MKLLIIGASSFIGTNFLLSTPNNLKIIATYNKQKRLSKLFAKQKNINLVKCNLLNEKQVLNLAKKVGKERINVLYLAGNTDPQASFSNPKADLQQNAIALINLLSKIKVNKFVYFSSGSVYHGLKGKVSPKSKLDPILPYAISKLACEQYVKYFHEKGTINQYVIIRFFGAYGPYEPKRKIYTKLINAFYLNKQNEFGIYGNGKNLIDAVYIDEVVKAIHKILNSKNVNLTIDLCRAKPITIEKLVKTAAKTFGITNLKINYKGKSVEPIYFKPSQKEMKKYFGITFKDNLKESLIRFTEYFNKIKIA